MDISPERLAKIAANLSGEPVVAVRRCGEGGNNRIYRIDTDRSTYALKSYGPPDVDDRDRLGHEFNGLRFLKAAGIGRVLPAAFAVDERDRCALYEWIEGRPASDHNVADVSRAVTFLRALHGVRHHAGASELHTATEAVVSQQDLAGQIERRLDRLAEPARSAPELSAFLQGEVQAELGRRQRRLTSRDRMPLDPRFRTLSPSDFGFHNALRRPDGTLTFIDFEYFGWDDPVKLTADFLWHPAMRLNEPERLHFLRAVTDLYGDEPDFLPRLAVCFPLYGIRWALIVLNEFLPAVWTRRRFSGGGLDWDAAKRVQLEKARRILSAVRSYEEGHLR